MPQTVLSGKASPSFLRSWRTWASTVRSSPNQPCPQIPSSNCWRDKALPGRSARNCNSWNSFDASCTTTPSTRAFPSQYVDLDAPCDENFAAFLGPPVRASKDGFDPRYKLARRERFGHVVVGAHLEAQHAVDLAVPCGQHQYRQRTAGPDTPANFQPVHRAGQPDVQDRHAGVLTFDRCQPGLPGAGLDDAEPLTPQVQVDEVGDVGVIFHHHDGPQVSAHVAKHASPAAASVRLNL